MKVLVACEESQRVCTAFRERGHEAYSCDVMDCSGGHPEWHIKGNVLPIIGGGTVITTCDDAQHEIEGLWDLVIAHPPCTYLTVTGNRWFGPQNGTNGMARYLDRLQAIEFFMAFVFCSAKRVAIENPVGIMSGVYRAPDQTIEPYWFGEHARKKTCLWLKNLPKLEPTDMVDPGTIRRAGLSDEAAAFTARDERGKAIRWSDPRTAIIRSRTFPGIAKAMAEQWG